MSTSENGKIIEKMYWDHVRAMSPAERFNKMLRLNAEVHGMVEMQILEKSPTIGSRALQYAIARRYYWNEPKVIQMLNEMETNEKESHNG